VLTLLDLLAEDPSDIDYSAARGAVRLEIDAARAENSIERWCLVVALAAALERHVSHWDDARVYGAATEVAEQALASLPAVPLPLWAERWTELVRLEGEYIAHDESAILVWCEERGCRLVDELHAARDIVDRGTCQVYARSGLVGSEHGEDYGLGYLARYPRGHGGLFAHVDAGGSVVAVDDVEDVFAFAQETEDVLGGLVDAVARRLEQMCGLDSDEATALALDMRAATTQKEWRVGSLVVTCAGGPEGHALVDALYALGA
jgi:hypothetical protein